MLESQMLKASLTCILVIVSLLSLADAEEISINNDAGESGIGISGSLDPWQVVVNSWDQNSVTAYSNDDMSLFKDMKTVFYPIDSSIEKLRTVSMYTYGANKIEIADTSWLQAQDDLGNTWSTGFERYSTLRDSNGMQPFGLITVDLERLTNEEAMGFDPALVNTQMTLLLSDTYDPARIAKLTEQLNSYGIATGTAFNIQTVNFNNYDEMVSLYGTAWSDWFQLFRDPEMWSLFKTALEGEGDLTYEDIMNRHFGDSNGPITCVWGSGTYTSISV
jgi:hypothetical protein